MSNPIPTGSSVILLRRGYDLKFAHTFFYIRNVDISYKDHITL